jgi:hypothetical protein
MATFVQPIPHKSEAEPELRYRGESRQLSNTTKCKEMSYDIYIYIPIYI